MKYFFYGTLRDPMVLETVLRRRVASADLRTARLADHACVYRRHATYPVLVAARGAETRGTLADRLSFRDVRLLADYEGPDYALARLSVLTDAGRLETVQAFLPVDPGIASRQPWSLEEWRRRHRAGFIARLQRRRRSWIADQAVATTPPSAVGGTGAHGG